MRTTIAALLILNSLSVSAWSTYDPNSGNQYYGYGNSAYGYNANTGSSWNSTTYGNTSYGTDSSGRSWLYDSDTGIYNRSDGRGCAGKGAYRTCW